MSPLQILEEGEAERREKYGKRKQAATSKITATEEQRTWSNRFNASDKVTRLLRRGVFRMIADGEITKQDDTGTSMMQELEDLKEAGKTVTDQMVKDMIERRGLRLKQDENLQPTPSQED